MCQVLIQDILFFRIQKVQTPAEREEVKLNTRKSSKRVSVLNLILVEAFHKKRVICQIRAWWQRYI
jgi:hypothetical protein